MSEFAMRIIHLPTNEYVEWAPGRSKESMIVDDLVRRVQMKGVGLFKTEAHVLLAIRESLLELIIDLKEQV